MVISVNIQETTVKIYSSQKLINEASYSIVINEEIDYKKAKGDSIIENLFQK